MYIEPALPDFEYVTIRRTGGFVGVDETLHVDRDLAARVADRHHGDRAFELDAFTSQELMTALARLVATNPAPSTSRGFDLFNYNVELSIDGRIHVFHSVDLGADEALHGVMLAANRLVRQDPDPIHPMTLHTKAVQA